MVATPYGILYLDGEPKSQNLKRQKHDVSGVFVLA